MHLACVADDATLHAMLGFVTAADAVTLLCHMLRKVLPRQRTRCLRLCSHLHCTSFGLALRPCALLLLRRCCLAAQPLQQPPRPPRPPPSWTTASDEARQRRRAAPAQRGPLRLAPPRGRAAGGMRVRYGGS